MRVAVDCKTGASFLRLNKDRVRLDWTTASQPATFGFDLERKDPNSNRFVRINETILPAATYAPHGASYQFIDSTATPGIPYTYRLLETEVNGRIVTHGPFTVTATETSPVIMAESDTSDFSSRAVKVSSRSLNRSNKAKKSRGKKQQE